MVSSPTLRYGRLSLFCTHFAVSLLFPGKPEFFGPLFIYCVRYDFNSDDLLYIYFFLFRGSNICQNHIQSNFCCNGHSDSPYIDSCLILSTRTTFLSPRWPLWRGSTVFIFTDSLLRVPFSQTGLWLMFYKARATAVPNLIDRIKFDFSTAVARRLKPSHATAV